MGAHAQCSEDFELALGWTDREAGRGRYAWTGIIDGELDKADDEPSLGSIERHCSAYGFSGRDGTGNQENWCDGARDDREDEHDGAEPDEDGERRWAGQTARRPAAIRISATMGGRKKS
jgi:hypothetical protein